MQQVTISTIAQDKSMRWTQEAKLDNIKENAHINVPDQYKLPFTDLILKHFKVVSIGKTDLGRAKDFFHKIHLKDNEPVNRKQFKIPDAHRPFLEEWLKLKLVQKSDSLNNSPVFCVPKKGGNNYRIVQDLEN
jgi:hypothetical protein